MQSHHFLSRVILARQFAVMALLLTITGCFSGSTDSRLSSSASGSIALKGSPLTGVVIQFVNPVTGDAVSAETDQEGKYQIEKIFNGDYLVSIFPAPPSPSMAPNPTAAPSNGSNIPKKYRSTATSELKAKVDSNPNTFDYDLK